MSTREEDIKWARENQQLQLLYSVVTASMSEVEKTADKPLKEKIKTFEDNMISLINLISNNNIPAHHLTRYLIVLINKVLLTKDEGELVNIKIAGIDKKIDQIISNIIILHKLCQKEDFRLAMCEIQANFTTDCIVNTESPAYNLRQQLQLWQLHLSKGESDPTYPKAKQQVQEIQSQIDVINKETSKVREFCDQYKVTPKTGRP